MARPLLSVVLRCCDACQDRVGNAGGSDGCVHGLMDKFELKECFSVLMDKFELMESFSCFSVLIDKFELMECFSVLVDKVELMECFSVLMDKFALIECFSVLMDKFALMECFSVLMDKFALMECFSVLMDKFELLEFSLALMDKFEIFVVRVVADFLGAAAAIAGIRVHLRSLGSVSSGFETESKRALIFQKDEGWKGSEEEVLKKENERLKEEQERKEEEETCDKEKVKGDIPSKKGVMTPALVILQQKAEHGSISSDVQLEGNRVGRVTNILVQGLDGKHLNMKIEAGTRVSVLCMELALCMGIQRVPFT